MREEEGQTSVMPAKDTEPSAANRKEGSSGTIGAAEPISTPRNHTELRAAKIEEGLSKSTELEEPIATSEVRKEPSKFQEE